MAEFHRICLVEFLSPWSSRRPLARLNPEPLNSSGSPFNIQGYLNPERRTSEPLNPEPLNPEPRTSFITKSVFSKPKTRFSPVCFPFPFKIWPSSHIVWTGHRSEDPGYESSVLVNYGVINFTNALNVIVDKPPCNCRRDPGFYGQGAQHGVQFRQGVTGYDQFKGFCFCLLEPGKSACMPRVRFYQGCDNYGCIK